MFPTTGTAVYGSLAVSNLNAKTFVLLFTYFTYYLQRAHLSGLGMNPNPAVLDRIGRKQRNRMRWKFENNPELPPKQRDIKVALPFARPSS